MVPEMKITDEEVRATARLARLALSDEEVPRMRAELDAILVYMERLASVNVEGVPPMACAVATAMPLREDVVGDELGTARALAGAPRSDGEHFEVPRVIAHDKERA